MSDVLMTAAHAAVESPPPIPATPREPADEPRGRLHELAAELARTRNRRLLVEYLKLRRATR